jgi:hypothetical protein
MKWQVEFIVNSTRRSTRKAFPYLPAQFAGVSAAPAVD